MFGSTRHCKHFHHLAAWFYSCQWNCWCRGWWLGDQICPILLSERGNLPFYIFPLLSVLSTAMDSDEKAANLFFQQWRFWQLPPTPPSSYSLSLVGPWEWKRAVRGSASFSLGLSPSIVWFSQGDGRRIWNRIQCVHQDSQEMNHKSQHNKMRRE